MTSKSHEDFHVIRCYSVIDPTLHQKGYTVYKVVEKKLNVETFDEAVQESVTWKRYNEFYKLYVSLSSLHASLHRREEFPDFPKPQLFHRFDAEVIKERMESAQDLLNFIGQRKYLVESRAFKEFFQDLKLLDSTVDCTPVLQPNKTSAFTHEDICNREAADARYECDDNDYDNLEDEYYLTEDDDYDEYDDDEDEDSEIFGSGYDTFSNRITPSDETQSLDSLIGDHCMTQSLHVANTLQENQFDGRRRNDGDDECAVDVRDNFFEVENEEDLTIEFSKKSAVLSKRGILKKSFFPMQAIWKTGKNLKHLLSASFHGSLPSPSKEESKQARKLKLMQMLNTKAYIVEAAHFIKEAKLKENCGLFGDAFDFYKNAIGTMLNGVQSDTNIECVEFVRSKISRYLTRAEELYKVHLQCREPYIFMPSNTNRYCRDILFLRGSSTDLGKFKVIGVLNKVMLVVDESSPLGNTYAMKVYPKASLTTRNQTNIVPSNVPFMIGIIKFYETETAIYALLPHIPTGTLWNHVAGYMQQSLQSDSTPDVFEDARNEVGTKECLEEKITMENSTSHDILLDSMQRESINKDSSELHKESNGQPEVIDQLFMSSESLQTKEVIESPSSSISKTSEIHHSRSQSDEVANYSDNEFREILKKNTNQCLSVFSINSSEGEPTPSILNNQTLAFDETLITSLHESHISSGSGDNQEVVKTQDYYVELGEKNNETSVASDNIVPANDVARSAECDLKVLVKRLSLGLSSSCSEISKKNVCESSKVRTSSAFEGLDLSGCCRVQSSNNDEVKRRNFVLLPDKFVKLWAAEMVIAICSLHECGIICRDLNPDNILIDAKGHMVLTYFCQWTTVEQRLKTSAIDNFYCAPELSSISKITRACDWWSFGVILFELLAGMSLKYYRPCGISPHTIDFFPPHLTTEAQSLLKRLIVHNPSERICVEEIKSHSFFHGIDWNSLR